MQQDRPDRGETPASVASSMCSSGTCLAAGSVGLYLFLAACKEMRELHCLHMGLNLLTFPSHLQDGQRTWMM